MKQTSQPQLSPDGRWYWNGQTWVPMPAVTKPKPQTAGWPAKWVSLLIIASFVVGMVVWSLLAWSR